ncbi:sensor histidine kinase [Pararhizobium sp.]|uniref:sensor histidine kinase n=1 Tax=Pararhizobium sp. TaxID=1977563 RepID=UPI00271F564A|nr:HWE histidine kinase domain-containing protein [Pararhizobium sp.]MDO9414670.1 HWE histidine kinase domain-containing protein [Pararhizobium sp.]
MFQNGGACGRLFREFDWNLSPLGRPEQWPSELRTLVSVMLGSLQPMLIVWGPQQITLYNDGYAAMCGNRHPAAFGHPFHDLWFDIWDQVDPIISAAYAGKGTSMDDIQFTMHRKGYPEETHFAFSYTPVRDMAGEVLGMFCACVETTGEVMMRREKMTQRERLLQVFELSPGGIAMLVGPDHIFEFANEEYYSMIGNREIIGKSVADGVAEVVRQGFVDLLDTVYRTGEPYVARGIPVELNRGPAGEKQDRFIDLAYQAMRDQSSGEITGILVQAQDVTERLAEEKHRDLLSHELGHRLKNQLAMVQAIASQTLRSARDMPTARRTLSDRIAVLSSAHDTVIQGGTGSSKVVELVQQMLALHDDPTASRFRISGPDMKIGSRSSLSMSLILHELATNAAKYGALTVPNGLVDIEWGIVGPARDRVQLVWKEHGGPAVSKPETEGSGSRLIRAGLAGAADSRVELAYEPDGLRCTVSADLAGFQMEH